MHDDRRSLYFLLATNPNNWHWKEKNATQWSKDKLKELLVGLKIETEEFVCEIKELKRCNGEASANNRKSKLVFLVRVELHRRCLPNCCFIPVRMGYRRQMGGIGSYRRKSHQISRFFRNTEPFGWEWNPWSDHDLLCGEIQRWQAERYDAQRRSTSHSNKTCRIYSFVERRILRRSDLTDERLTEQDRQWIVNNEVVEDEPSTIDLFSTGQREEVGGVGTEGSENSRSIPMFENGPLSHILWSRARQSVHTQQCICLWL